ncbi:MAG TPA: hypothetical protein PK767_02765 [Clostridiales bacterium]|nr:hypothetical protein [Clostridiales bacterium]HOL91038.1 hypothetical protein [Clostridiales bacterium]HPP35148.1 hypothetical protein [Clostridiales bacterium]
MPKMFPRTEVGGVSLSRMIIGTNWLLGWSHRSPAADNFIKSFHSSKEAMSPLLETFLGHGVDTIMGPISSQPLMLEAIRHAEDRTGKKMIMIDTPIINVKSDSLSRKEAYETIKRSAGIGSKFCLLHHSSVEQLVRKDSETIERLDEYTKMIREQGMIPGLSAHMPELVVYSDKNGYDVETYIQIYNCMGFLMQVEVEYIAKVIQNAKKPVITIKPMAAGRVTPFVGLTFVWNTIRPCDMVTVGCMTEQEADEDIEISLAAIEHRFPGMGQRSSPNPDQAAFANR